MARWLRPTAGNRKFIFTNKIRLSKDLFSTQAADYARYRPAYPAQLIEYILGFVETRETAWDCATGNGQAALLLSPYFKQVMATDLSEKQLRQAARANNIIYSTGSAEHSSFADNSFNLITIAQAYHWFHFNDFEQEARRVAKPGAIVAAWGYNIPASENKEINRLIHHFYTAVAGPFWDAERKWVDDSYQTIPFSFETIPSKTFAISVQWTVADLAGYFSTWSSVQHFIKAKGYKPVNEIAEQLAAAWPRETSTVHLSFPVFLRLGRIEK